MQRRLVGGLADERVGVDLTAAGGAQVPDCLDVRRSVHQLEFSLGRRWASRTSHPSHPTCDIAASIALMRSGVSGWSGVSRRGSCASDDGWWKYSTRAPDSATGAQPPELRSGGTASTGHGAMCSRRWVTLPISSPVSAVRPRVPTTITSECSWPAIWRSDGGAADLAARHLERRRRAVGRQLCDLSLDLGLDVILVGVDREASAALPRERKLLAVHRRHRSASVAASVLA